MFKYLILKLILESTTALAGSFGPAAAAATAGTGLLGTQAPPTTAATTTAYDAYGNNVAQELLTTPYETEHFAYAKPCFWKPLSFLNKKGFDLCSIGV